MEIIFLVLATFSGGRLTSFTVADLDDFLGERGIARRPCRELIRTPSFIARLAKEQKPGRDVRVECVGGSELAALEPLLAKAPTWERVSVGELVVGRLEHRPVDSGRKSVEAHVGIELWLVRDGGVRTGLRPTLAVPRDVLLRLKGQRVEVRLVPSREAPVDERMQMPITPEGKPLPRGGFDVTSIRALP